VEVREYLDSARTLIVGLDPAGRVSLVNRHGCELLGGRESQILGRDWFETFLFPEQAASVRAVFQRILDGDLTDVQDYENPIRTLGGERRDILWHNSVVTDADGRVVEILGSGEDVTERNLAERALRESDAKNRALLDALPDLMFRLSRSGIHLDFHAPARGELLVAPEAFLGKGVEEVLPAEVADTYRSRITEALASGEAQTFQYELSFPDRGVRAYEARMVVSGADEVLVIVRDVSDRKQLELQLRQTQKMEALGQLAAGVAHDFNNILTAIQGNAELASRQLAETEATEMIRESLDQIRESARSAAGLTKRLLGFTRQQAIEPAVLDMARLLHRMMAMLRRLIGEEIELSLSTDADLHTILADAGQIEQIVINLVVNARDAIEGRGRIEIRAANADVAEPSSRWPGMPPGAYVQLSVRDDGLGMDEETAARVFEPFFTTKVPGKGTGLGLSTVYGIVKHCRGRVEVESAPGAGADFRVLLPAAEAVGWEAGEPPAAPTRGEVATVLVCEDDPVVRRLMVAILESGGHRVLEADRGRAALKRAVDHPGKIDVLVTDVITPGMNGRELSDALSRRRPGIRTLFVSGYAADHLVPREGERVAFLQKPFSRDELLSRVAEVLSRELSS